VVIDAHLHLWDTERLRTSGCGGRENAVIKPDVRSSRTSSPGAEAAGVDQAVLVQADDSAADTDAMFEVRGGPPRDRRRGRLGAPRPARRGGERLGSWPGGPPWPASHLIHDQPDPDWRLRRAPGDRREGSRCSSSGVVPVRRDRGAAAAPEPRAGAVRALSRAADGPRPPGPPAARRHGYREWRALITAAAANPLVCAKVSGLYPPHDAWTADDLAEVAEFAFGLFGPEAPDVRSDWPVAEMSGGYAKVRTELSRLFARLTPGDRTPSWAAPPRASTPLPTPED